MSPLLLYPLLTIVPAGILAATVKVWRWLEDFKGPRMPVTDRLLRSPGETARRNAEKLDDKATDILIWVLALPATLLVSSMAPRLIELRPIPGFWTFVLIALAAAFVLTLGRFIALLKDRDNWRLDFSGERAVGEELNMLMLEGCRVFHDFPLAENGNINHVVVAPSGVYAIETKAKRKLKSSASQKAHEVVYDGKGLQFPHSYEREDTVQAKKQAERLGQFLCAAVRSPVPVNPVLTLPGWYVISKRTGDVTVLNPKQIESLVLGGGPPALSPERIRQIARHLDQRCRDVEF